MMSKVSYRTTRGHSPEKTSGLPLSMSSRIPCNGNLKVDPLGNQRSEKPDVKLSGAISNQMKTLEISKENHPINQQPTNSES